MMARRDSDATAAVAAVLKAEREGLLVDQDRSRPNLKRTPEQIEAAEQAAAIVDKIRTS